MTPINVPAFFAGIHQAPSPCKIFGSVIMLIVCQLAPGIADAGFAVARGPVPVFNVPDVASIGGSGRPGPDRCGQVRELEFIALAGTAFRILSRQTRSGILVYRVTTAEYSAPPGRELFIDARQVDELQEAPPERTRRLPEKSEIIRRLKSQRGLPYFWGSNRADGLEGLVPQHEAGPDSSRTPSLAGLDCSGLLYQATDGWTPRNTSELVHFGTGVPIAGKTVHQIIVLLKPLDLIVWNGHVVIVLDPETAIESRLECGRKKNGGVITTRLAARLSQIMAGRKPADSWPRQGRPAGREFVVRRWYP